MKRSKTARPDLGEHARRVLLEAAGPEEPDVSRLIDQVPEIVAAAEHRRANAARLGPLVALIPMAQKAIPRFAAVAATLLLVALVFGPRDADRAVSIQIDLDGYLLTGDTGDGLSDVLFEAIASEETDDG